MKKGKEFVSWFLCIFMAVIPWISKSKYWKLNENVSQVMVNTNGVRGDFFLYYRECLVILAGVILLGIFFFRKGRPVKKICLKEKRTLIWVWVGSIMLLILLSAVFSENRSTVLMGSVTCGEGVFCLLAYGLLFLAAMEYLQTESAGLLFRKTCKVIMWILVVLTLLEYFGGPLFKQQAFVWILEGLDGEYEFQLSSQAFRGFVSLTFYNPNYYGGFCLLFLPVAQYFMMECNQDKMKVVDIFLFSGMVFGIIAANSSVAFYLGILEIVVGTVLYSKKKDIGVLSKKCVIAVAVIALICCAGDILTDKKVASILLGELQNRQVGHSVETSSEKIWTVKDIEIQDNRLILTGTDKVLNAVYENGAVHMRDDHDHTILSAIGEDGALELLEEGYEGIRILARGNQLAFDLGYKDNVVFYLIDGCFYGVGVNESLLEKVSTGHMDERFGKKLYGVFSGRGYAWLNTLPILKTTIFLGKGAGTFAEYFPQGDYVGLLNTHGSQLFVIDKPHNAYLQYAVEEGVLTSVLILMLILYLCVQYMKIDRITNTTIEKSLLISVLFFLTYSVFNDSMVTVTPVFCILFGKMAGKILKYNGG